MSKSSRASSEDLQLLHALLHGILHVLEFGNFHVADLAIHLLHPADINGVDDVPRLRIDRDRAARAFPAHALYGADQAVAVHLSPGLLQRLVNDVHAVVPTDGEEVRVSPKLGFVGRDELLVERGVVGVVVMERRDDADRGFPDCLERALLGELALPDDPDLARVHAALDQRLGQGHRLRSPRYEDKIVSAPESLARWTNAEKSGLASGTRTEPMISPPA